MRTEILSAPGSSTTALPWKLFGGIGAGYGVVTGSEYSEAPGGAHYLVSGALSFEGARWILDGGLSWLASRVSGTDSRQRPIEIRTRAGLLDAGARYRLSERWQLGPQAALAYGTDTAFGPVVGDPTRNAFVGLRLAYELPRGDYAIRLWQQILTDVLVPGRQAILFMAGIQFGLPLFGDSKTLRAARTARPLPGSALSGIRKADREVRLVLDPKRVFFGTNSDRLRPDVRRLLLGVGRYLGGAPDGWGSLIVSGHADRRGRYAYNLRLSGLRARSVERALDLTGRAAARVKVEAHSYLDPLDAANNRKAWSRNRRVELVFLDVMDPEMLIRKLEPLVAAATPVEER